MPHTAALGVSPRSSLAVLVAISGPPEGPRLLVRRIIAEAAQAAGLAMHYVSPRSPHDPGLAKRVAELGRAAGPPWRKEHELAAGAALTALIAPLR